jgi:putative ABC transport system permease protein
MMIFLRLAWKSLNNRRLTTGLTVASIALSMALLLAVERAKRAAEEGFTQTISQTDLIVGARSGPINLILYSVFNMGSATNNISVQTYEDIKKNPAIEWTIPYSLGDGHRGFRVVGTDENFYQHYRFRGDSRVELAEGSASFGLWDAVIGADVAKDLGYKLSQKIVIAHGVTKGQGILMHDDKPFTVVGIMKATGTALDRSIYITLEGLEALHIDWQSGAMPTKEQMIPPERIKKEDIKIKMITAFFLRTNSRIETLRLQREINTYVEEPLLAIIPGVTLAELWRGLGYVEQTLRIIALMVVAVGLVAMLIALLTGLNERRREMAILRALGASSSKIVALLVFESTVLTVMGVALGVGVQLVVFQGLKSWIEREFGLYLVGALFTPREIAEIFLMIALGAFIGLVPALRAMRLALKDGLSQRV